MIKQEDYNGRCPVHLRCKEKGRFWALFSRTAFEALSTKCVTLRPSHSHMVRRASALRTAAVCLGPEGATQSAPTIQHGTNSAG